VLKKNGNYLPKNDNMSKVLVILGELSDRDIDWMLANGTRNQIPIGTELIHEGQPIDALYIVLEGVLSVSVSSLGNIEIGKIISGEVLGEMSFVDGRLPSASVKAIKECLILSIPRQKLTEKLEQDVLFSLRFYRAITKLLSTRLRGTVSRFSEESDHLIFQDSSTEEPHQFALENQNLGKSRYDRLIEHLTEKQEN
jgi:CRP/FNR family cyclic AMP-dependent transcriptional regulator